MVDQRRAFVAEHRALASRCPMRAGIVERAEGSTAGAQREADAIIVADEKKPVAVRPLTANDEVRPFEDSGRAQL